MSYIIVVRVLPVVPTDGTTFTGYLTNLSLTAYDRTVSNTSPDLVTGEHDVFIGTASGLAPQGLDAFGNQAEPVFGVIPGSNPPAYNNSIIQHYESVITSQPPSPPSIKWNAKAAATALIVVNLDTSTHHEYVDSTEFDVRMAVSRSGTTVPIPLIIEYNIVSVASLLPGNITTAENTYEWATTLAASLYIWVPPPPSSTNVGSVSLGDGSTPPNFYTLAAAIDKVLAKDSPPSAPTLESLTAPLTVAQCSEIASELIYERTSDPPPDPPLPTSSNPAPIPQSGIPPPTGIELFYTTSDNTNPSSTQSNSPTWVCDFRFIERLSLYPKLHPQREHILRPRQSVPEDIMSHRSRKCFSDLYYEFNLF